MQDIRAFVGHSFTKDDEQVVTAFLKHFTALSKAHPAFTWEHAEDAAPEELSKKVLGLIEGKNVFIGICTRKERAIPDQKLARAKFTKRRYAEERDLDWKTSDWIIQEIGLAIGRDMKLVLFLEEGVRRPGGLQGNIEFIPFSRGDLADAFSKFLEMVSNIDPRPTAGLPTQSTAPQEQKVLEEQANATEDDWTVPKADWTDEKYDIVAFHFILVEDAAGLQTITTSFKTRNPLGEKADVWDARIEQYRIMFGKGGDFPRLQSLSEKHPSSGEIAQCLAYAYEEYGDVEKANQAFERAASLMAKPSDKVQIRGRAALALAKAGETERALSALERIRSEADQSPDSQFLFAKTIHNVASALKQGDLELVALERLLDLRPDNIDERFNLAYKHSQLDNEDMALSHYLRIPEGDRQQLTWNNIGASLDGFHLPVRSVRAYRRAEALGETLAMSNLAYKFLGAGFKAEAQALCDKGMAIKDYHKNFNDLATRLGEVDRTEEEAEREVLVKAKPKAAFYKQLGDALVEPQPTNIPEHWKSADAVLKLTVEGDLIQLSGSFEREGNTLGGLLGLGMGSGSEGKKVRHHITYSAQFYGRMLIGHVSRSQEGKRATIAGSGSDPKVLMFFDKELARVHVMEDPHSTSPSIYSLMRQ